MEGSKLPTIKIGGREIPLFYSSYELISIQKDIGCTAFQLNDEVFGVHREDPDDDDSQVRFDVVTDPEKTKKLGILIRILGNAGLEEAGEAADLTDKWVLRAMKPAALVDAVNACMEAMSEGMASEIPEKESDEPVDVTLEQMKKKETKES